MTYTLSMAVSLAEVSLFFPVFTIAFLSGHQACINRKAGELVRVTTFRFFMTIRHAKLCRLIETGVISLTLESTGVVKIIGDTLVQSTKQQKTLLLPTKSHGTHSIMYQMQHKAWHHPHSSQYLDP